MMNVVKAGTRSRREACEEHDETTRLPKRRAFCVHAITQQPDPGTLQRRLGCRRGESLLSASAENRHCVPVALPTTAANAPVVVA